RREHPAMLELMTKRVEGAKLPPHEQPAADRDFEADVKSLPESAIYTRLMVPSLVKVSAACTRHHAGVRCAYVLAAVERYRQEEGKWPASLTALVPKSLRAVPLDPWDGKPRRYRKVADGVIVYSVGHDGIDNGGVLARQGGMPPGTDQGYQLWDVEKRRGPAP